MNLTEPEGESSSNLDSEEASSPPPTRSSKTDNAIKSALECDRQHTKNFGLAVLYMVFMRTGWIFKTESIIMPAVLDVIGGSGWLRGCLPMLNRFGQSVPPLLASNQIRNARFKKYRLFTTTLMMGLCFLVLSGIWWLTSGEKNWWMPFVFLVIYGIFFSSTGINQLVLYTVSGKLIRVVRRGRLALLGTVFGATTAVLCAWFLLNLWLVDGNGAESKVADGTQSNFVAIFAFTGMAFVMAAIVALFMEEHPDEEHEQGRGGVALFRSAVSTVIHDSNFRTVTMIGALFGMYLTLFPHYQRLGRDRLDLGLTALIPWVLAQNIGAALFSIPSGWIADRFGNRLVLRVMMLVLCVAPIMALGLARLGDVGQPWFTVVFCLLGLTPVTMRILNNYTLELVENRDHPRYLSTLSIAMAVPPVLLSPLFGALIDWISFEFVFCVVVICVFCGWMLTFRIDEPRRRLN